MKSLISILALAVVGTMIFFAFKEPVTDTWKQDQLIKPLTLSDLIKTGNSPVIFDIGPVGRIQGAIEIGGVQEDQNFERFKAVVAKVPKNKQIVVYCGCCPFKNCPNIRPTMKYLNEAGYTQAFLLDLPQNLKTDWIDKGYPMQN